MSVLVSFGLSEPLRFRQGLFCRFLLNLQPYKIEHHRAQLLGNALGHGGSGFRVHGVFSEMLRQLASGQTHRIRHWIKLHGVQAAFMVSALIFTLLLFELIRT